MKKLYRIIADSNSTVFRPQAWSLRTGWYNITSYSQDSKEKAKQRIEEHSDRRLKRKVWIGFKVSHMKASDWKEVFCEVPEINTLCLVCKGAHTPQVLCWDGEGWSNETHYYRRSYFTHWMPIVMPYEKGK